MSNETRPEQRTLEMEKLLCGEWYNKATGQSWLFSQIPPNSRYGKLLISEIEGTAKQLHLEYEVIWVKENLVFLNLIHASIDLLDQYQMHFRGTNALELSLPETNETISERTVLQR